MVFASSGGTIYGDVEQLPIKESQAQRPLSPYGVAKKTVGDYLFAYRELHGLEYTALALANVYGPRQDLRGEAGVVAIFAGRLLSASPASFSVTASRRGTLSSSTTSWTPFRGRANEGPAFCATSAPASRRRSTTFTPLWPATPVSTQPPMYTPARSGELQRNSPGPGPGALHLGWKPWTTIDKGTAAVIDWSRQNTPA